MWLENYWGEEGYDPWLTQYVITSLSLSEVTSRVHFNWVSRTASLGSSSPVVHPEAWIGAPSAAKKLPRMESPPDMTRRLWSWEMVTFKNLSSRKVTMELLRKGKSADYGCLIACFLAVSILSMTECRGQQREVMHKEVKSVPLLLLSGNHWEDAVLSKKVSSCSSREREGNREHIVLCHLVGCWIEHHCDKSTFVTLRAPELNKTSRWSMLAWLHPRKFPVRAEVWRFLVRGNHVP